MNDDAAALPGEADPAFEVGALLDAAPVTRAHIVVVALATAAVVLDGFDLQALAYAAPALIQQWGTSRAALAPIFAASIVGVGLGSLLIGPRGDVWGRKRALIASVLFFAAATFACAFATTPAQLLVLRFLAGLGLGGALPNATALVNESVPLRWRAMLTSVTVIGVPIGGVVGGEVAARLIPAWGWPSIFVVGGIAPLVLAAALALWLPESARFLLRTGRVTPALLATVNRLQRERRFGPRDPLWLREPAAAAGASLSSLFRAALGRETAGLWTMFLANIFAVYCFMNWLPAILVDLGHDIGSASRLLAVYNLGGVAGTLVAATLMRSWGSRAVLAGLAALAVLNALAMGSADLSVWRNALVLAAIAGACINAVQVCTYVLAAHVYPTAIRTTGVGAALGVGRAGAVLSSFAGALVGAGAAGAANLFLMVGAAMLVVFAGVFVVRRHVPPQ